MIYFCFLIFIIIFLICFSDSIMDSEHQPLAASSSELYSQDAPTTSSAAFSHESMDVTGKSMKEATPWYIPPKRYIIALMAFLGFGKICSSECFSRDLYYGQRCLLNLYSACVDIFSNGWKHYVK